MKFNIAIAALLGVISVQGVSLNKHHHHSHENVQIRPNPVQQPWSAKPPKPEDMPTVTKVTDAFTKEEDGSAYYKREVPAMYTEEKDDRLMWSLINRYSVEGRTADKPNGHFFMLSKDMERVSREVI